MTAYCFCFRGFALWSVFALLLASAGSAQAADVDWKVYGAANVDQKAEVCFYEANGVTAKPDTLVRVWAKCLLQADIKKIDVKKAFGGAILEESATRVAHHYLPPLATVEITNSDQIVDYTLYEVIADLATNLEPTGRMLYEIDCSEKKVHELSIFIRRNGATYSRNTPSDWQYIAPETNVARLAKLLCP